MPIKLTPQFVLKGFQPKHFAIIKPGTAVPLKELKTETKIDTIPSLTPVIASTLTSSHTISPVRILPVARVGMTAARLKPMVNVRDMRLIQPDLARLISLVPFKERGVPRNRIKVPISLSREISDTVLLEDPTDSTKKLYIPRYRLAEKKISGKSQFQVSLKEKNQGEGGTLSICLEKYPAEELGEKSRNATEINHALNIKLKYHISIGGSGSAENILDFQEYTETVEGIKATLDINNLAELTQVFQAITNTDFKTTLMINRVFTAAIPIEIQPRINALNHQITQINQANEVLSTRNDMLSNQMKEIRNRRNPQITGSINITINRTNEDIKYKNQELLTLQTELRELQITPLFRETTKNLEQFIEPQPFVFPKELHPYVTESVTGSQDQEYGLIRHRVNWENNYYSYFQSQAQTNIFYYLPDNFKIARRPESPHYPIMSAQCTQSDDTSQDLQIALEYVAVPHVNPARLESAEEQLREYLDDSSENVSMEFQPLQGVDPDKVHFKLALPRSDISEGPYKERLGAIVTLKGIQDILVLSLEDFRSIYDALFGGSSVLFQGNVEIDLGDEEFSEMIPFEARLDDFSGELLDYKEVPKDETGSVTANLRNAIESPIEISELKAFFDCNGKSVKAEIKELALPVILQPGEEVEFDIIPTVSIPGEEPLTVLFEFREAKVLSDSEKVLNVIFDPNISAHPSKEMKVQTVPGIFKLLEQDTLLVAVDVVFESGEMVEFTSLNCPKENQPFCSEKIEINLPLSDYILGKVNEGEYRYCVTAIKSDGTSIGTIDNEHAWRKAKHEILWIQTADIPSEEG